MTAATITHLEALLIKAKLCLYCGKSLVVWGDFYCPASRHGDYYRKELLQPLGIPPPRDRRRTSN